MSLPYRILVAESYAEMCVETAWSDRRLALPGAVESLISGAWAAAEIEAAGRGRRIFPGAMARLNGWSATDRSLKLELGPTDYRVFVGTNLRHPELAASFGRNAMACPLGISVAVRTADERIVLQRRSETVYEYPGFFHVCGGNVEPVDVAGTDAPGVFASARRELDEELGIGLEAIEEIACLGLVENSRTLKPELLTEARVCLSAADFDSTTHSEYSNLVLLDADALATFLRSNGHRTAPGGLACLLALGKRDFGADWQAIVLAELERDGSSPSEPF
jgi:8-oxo-dGTP pyrophosphatase MutT (NUDIX family)